MAHNSVRPEFENNDEDSPPSGALLSVLGPCVPKRSRENQVLSVRDEQQITQALKPGWFCYAIFNGGSSAIRADGEEWLTVYDLPTGRQRQFTIITNSR